MDPILEIARRRGLLVIEDAAQAHGAEYKGRRAGSLGDMGCFSFYPGKNLGAYGEGGMVVTNNADYTRTIRMLRDWGAEKKYQHVLKGYNYPPGGDSGRGAEGQATASGSVDRSASCRCGSLRQATGRQRSADARGDVVRATRLSRLCDTNAARRQQWQEALHAQGIQTGIHYPIPVHLLPAFADLGYAPGDFPIPSKRRTKCYRCRCLPS